MVISASRQVAAAFYLTNYTIRLNLPGDEVLALVERPESAPVSHLATLYHELHHFFTTLGSSFAYLCRGLELARVDLVLGLAALAHDTEGKVHKPLLSWLATAEALGASNADELCSLREDWLALDELLRAIALGDVFPFHAAHTGLAAAVAPSTRRVAFAKMRAAEAARAAQTSGSKAIVTDADCLRAAVEETRRASTQLATRTPAACSDRSIHPVLEGQPLDWTSLVEGAAAGTESLYRAANGLREPLRTDVYERARKAMEDMFVASHTLRRASLFEFMFLFDLAANPSITPAHYLPEPKYTPRGLLDVLPGWRFVAACEVAGRMAWAPPSDFMLYELDDIYRSYGVQLCTELGWEPPWVYAERMVEAHAHDFHTPSEQAFRRVCEIRAKHPALLSMFPIHPQSRFLTDSIECPRLAGSDTAPSVYLGGSALDDRRTSMYETEAELSLTRYVDQLMFENGPFDTSGDPERIAGEFARAEHDALTEYWRGVLDPSEIVFD